MWTTSTAGTVVGKLEGDPNMIEGYYDTLKDDFIPQNAETGIYLDHDILEKEAKNYPSLQSAIDTWGEISFNYESTDTPDVAALSTPCTPTRPRRRTEEVPRQRIGPEPD